MNKPTTIEKPEFPVSPSISPSTARTTRETKPESNAESLTVTDALFPEEVFTNLPEILQQMSSPFEEVRDRTVVLLSSLVVVGTLFHKYYFTYRQRYYPCFNALIIGHSASGKGLVKWPVKTLEPIQRMYDAEFKEALTEFKQSKEKAGGPMRKQHVIPGDASNAGMLRQLQSNQGQGLIFETEADTMANSMRQEWGDFSTILRKAFEHEAIATVRKQQGDSTQIDVPKSGVLVSGTHGQIPGIVSSAENGLFSRFAYLIFNDQVELRNIFKESADVSAHFEEVSKRVYTMWQSLPENEVEVKFSDDQKDSFFDWLQTHHGHMNALYGEVGMSVISRMGVVLLRIAAVLSICRSLESDLTEPHVSCNDEDLGRAMTIAGVLLEHSSRLLDLMPENRPPEIQTSTRRELLHRLPDEFTKRKALAVGGSLKIKGSSVEKYLKAYLNAGYLQRPKQGHYRKV